MLTVRVLETGNQNMTMRINTVTQIAAISRGKDRANNPVKRFEALTKEAMPNYSVLELNSNVNVSKVAGRPLEFLPVKLRITCGGVCRLYDSKMNEIYSMPLSEYVDKIGRYSYVVDATLYTNARALLNAGVKLKDIPFTDTTGYIALHVKAPYFSFAQIRTHGAMSQIAVSERMVDTDEMWLPDDIVKRINDYGRYGGYRTIADIGEMLEAKPYKDAQGVLRDIGYPKEIWQRYPNHLKYKEWIVGGWIQDPKQWGHLLLERSAYEDRGKEYSNWTQDTTKLVAKLMKQEIEAVYKGEHYYD